MKEKINYPEFIDRYLDKDMSGPELNWFENELDSNPELQAELKLQKELNDALGQGDILDLREKLNVIHEMVDPEPERKRIKRTLSGNWAGIAAASAVILVAIGFLLSNFINPVQTAEELFDQHYEPYIVPTNYRSAAEINIVFHKALVEYGNQDYQKALQLFEKVLVEDESRMDVTLLTGISNLEIENYYKANNSFQKVINHNDNLFIEQAEWYLALCYLKTGEQEKAHLQFGKIITDNSLYKEEAEDILNKLGN
jgi:tetratricopeptide (TPR) repeat protein